MLDNLTTLYKSLHHLDISSERSKAAYARLVKHINTGSSKEINELLDKKLLQVQRLPSGSRRYYVEKKASEQIARLVAREERELTGEKLKFEPNGFPKIRGRRYKGGEEKVKRIRVNPKEKRQIDDALDKLRGSVELENGSEATVEITIRVSGDAVNLGALLAAVGVKR